ncbi:hypothetical protein SteCoe_20009 [Stentor coeruleus]|uniref:Membrane transporter protein n=1 Tax=Stentor coeruleus TaxID=5963 RepID=A0A1R2BSZ0_9CILI|nr:hypothetical protein SteCoe_20009 [Stentor coeruleus]
MNHYFILLLVTTAYSCQLDSECSSGEICNKGQCDHKSLFPMTGLEVLSTFLIFSMSGLAGASGIGGGVLYVIFFITMFNFNPSDAVALSQFTMVGTSFTASFIKIFHRHPSRNRPLIDYDIISILISPLLIGTTLGVMLNITSPYWLILLILTAALAYLTSSTVISAKKHYIQESQGLCNSVLIKDDIEEDLNPNLQNIYAIEKQILPLKNILIIISVYILTLFSSLIGGSKTFKSLAGIEFCSEIYWTLLGLFIGILLVITLGCSKMLIKKYLVKVSYGYEFDDKDIKWDNKSCIIISCSGFFAGMIGALVGVGGALVVSPVLLKIGIRPEVLTATTSFLIFFTSTVSSLKYLISGKVNVLYGLWGLAFALIGSALGVFVIKAVVENYKRSSLIIMVLALALGISTISIVVYGIHSTISQDNDFGFHDYC